MKTDPATSSPLGHLPARRSATSLALLAAGLLVTSPASAEPQAELVQAFTQATSPRETSTGTAGAAAFDFFPNDIFAAASASVTGTVNLFGAPESGGTLSVRASAERNPPSQVSPRNATARATFRLNRPASVIVHFQASTGSGSAKFDGGSLPFPISTRVLPAGSYTVEVSADNSTGAAAWELKLTFSAPPGPGPDPDPEPGDFDWKSYVDGQWSEGERWKGGTVPGGADVARFLLLPPESQRIVPLPFIQVRAELVQTAGGMDISRSAVRVVDFDLDLKGTASEPDALTIRDGGELSVELLSPSAGRDRLVFKTAGAALGDGRPQRLGRRGRLGECGLFIGEGVVWTNTGALGIGERMAAAVQIETRLPDGTASQSTGDVLLGLRPQSGGDLLVLGDFSTSALLGATRPKTSGSVVVERGGLLRSASARLASARGTSLVAFVKDEPAAEAGGPRDYTSEGERSTWEIAGLLSLSGELAGAAGPAGGGVSLVEVQSGALLTAAAADVGAGRATSKLVKGRVAGVVVSGFDPLDAESSEFRVAGNLLVGEGCEGTVGADEGGLVSAANIRVKALGRLRSAGRAPVAAANDDPTSSLITTARETDTGTELGEVKVDGGGRVELARSGDLTTGLFQLGGVTPRQLLARLRIDSLDLTQPRSSLTVRRLVVGAGVGFPARFDLIDGLVSITENSLISAGSRLTGFGRIGSTPDVELLNEGEIIVSPGAGRQLVIAGDFAQGPTGRLVLTVDKTNNASTAPLQADGGRLTLNGEITLRFAGGRRPRPGEAFALIRAENTLITNNARFKVAGAKGAFDIVEDPLGLALVFR